MLKVVQISESEFSVKGHGVHTAYIETTAALKKRSDVVVAVNSRQAADIIHIHTVGPYALERLLFGKGKKIVSAHIVPDSLVGSLRGAKLWYGLAKSYLRWFYNRADIVIAVSHETKHVLKNMGVNRPVAVIHNMIDVSRYSALPVNRVKLRQELGIARDDWVIVSNGQVQPRKRVDIFIALARELPDFRFVWVGGIPFKGAAAQYEKMKKLMNSAPKNVQFTGVIPLDLVSDYLQVADVFIMPSDQETFGLAIVEAAAASLPVVLRNISDYDHTFRDDAIICEEHEFGQVLLRLHDDVDYREQAVRSARNLACKYDSSILCEKLVGVYRSAL